MSSSSSGRWIARHLSDPWVHKAVKESARSRAYFKLEGILQQQRGLLFKGARVVDLGAAPGGWSLAAQKRIGEKGTLVSVDLLPFEPISGGVALVGDFRDLEVREEVRNHLPGGLADCVMSDMHGGSTGDQGVDHARSLELCQLAAIFSMRVLAPNGSFLSKIVRGGSEEKFAAQLRRVFKKVSWKKPPASRSESSEIFVCATGFLGMDGVRAQTT